MQRLFCFTQLQEYEFLRTIVNDNWEVRLSNKICCFFNCKSNHTAINLQKVS